jgi:membrane-bound metal-dependent hydrolase YbcI (DUF457 family)
VAQVSWATHDVEPYVIIRHVRKLEEKIGFRISFLAVLIGSWAPDMMTKWYVYGSGIGPWHVKAANPQEFHRSWPGAGFTHSLLWGVVVGVIIWLIFHRRAGAKPWAIGLCIGIWAHVLSDTLDSRGVMMFFPFTTERVHFDAWAYAGQTGRFVDARAYFSGLGFVWDGFWIAMVLLNWKVLRAKYFREYISLDPVWGFLARRRIPESALLAVYRMAFFYGVGRWVSWLIWVHVFNSTPFDPTWGGPDWVKPALTILLLGGGGCPCCGGAGGICRL